MIHPHPPTPRALTRESLAQGAWVLARRDSDLADLLCCHGLPPMWGRRPGFASLLRIILEQQVSLASAATLYRKLQQRAGSVTPHRIARLGADGLRTAGLTRQKARYCIGLAERLLQGELNLSAIAAATDDTARRQLLAVPGLGPWSVDVYFLMALRRPDVWPMGDLALAVALQRLKGLAQRPDEDAQRKLTAAWSPWRSVAARILWMDYLSAKRRGN